MVLSVCGAVPRHNNIISPDSVEDAIEVRWD